ncbi:MAG: corrinoid protein [Deltaproteobacteria bacterium]|nr:corrinoid protein [Deltaproteobacteria bacterium]
MTLESLNRLVESGDKDQSEFIVRKLLEEGVSPQQLILTLTEMMTRLGEKFSRLEIFLPEIMIAGDAMMAVVEIIRPRLLESGLQASRGKVVLGTVKGDLHEIGKNIVKLILETNGFQVRDLRYDVDPLDFIKEAEAMKADFIGASSLMSTTMPSQREIIDLLKDKGIRDRYKVVIGGAPTTQLWADSIGADLYCADAYSAPDLMTDLMNR